MFYVNLFLSVVIASFFRGFVGAKINENDIKRLGNRRTFFAMVIIFNEEGKKGQAVRRGWGGGIGEGKREMGRGWEGGRNGSGRRGE